MRSAEHQTAVRARAKLPDIGEVQVLSDEKTANNLSRRPNVRITITGNSFEQHGIDVVTESLQPLNK